MSAATLLIHQLESMQWMNKCEKKTGDSHTVTGSSEVSNTRQCQGWKEGEYLFYLLLFKCEGDVCDLHGRS